MTRAQEVYASTLNLFGSDVPDAEMQSIQDIIDNEHALADPGFAELLRARQLLKANG